MNDINTTWIVISTCMNNEILSCTVKVTKPKMCVIKYFIHLRNGKLSNTTIKNT